MRNTLSLCVFCCSAALQPNASSGYTLFTMPVSPETLNIYGLQKETRHSFFFFFFFFCLFLNSIPSFVKSVDPDQLIKIHTVLCPRNKTIFIISNHNIEYLQNNLYARFVFSHYIQF